MKKFKLILPMILLFSLVGQAQIGLKVKSKHYNNLVYDGIEVTVRFENYTGNTLLFPSNPQKPGLTFDIFDSKGNKIYPSKGFKDVVAGQVFKSARTVEATVDLTKFYTLQKAGTYRCRAVVSHPMLQSAYMSKEIMFHLADPPIRKKFTVGLPIQKGDKFIKKRNYNLLIFESDGGAYYYLRIDDDKKVYKTVPLAVKRTNYHPQIQIDSSSCMHIFIYSNPQIFDYLVVDFTGRILKHEKYQATGSRPLLSKDPDVGRVVVVGGVLAVEGVDYVKDDTAEVAPRLQESPADISAKMTRGKTAESIFDRSERELEQMKSPDDVRKETKSSKSIFDTEQEKEKAVEKPKSIFD